MISPPDAPHSLPPEDDTLVAPRAASEKPPGASPLRFPKVELVSESCSGLSGETQALLHVRLRGATLMLLLGSLAFLIRSWLVGNWLSGDGAELTDPTFLADSRWLSRLHVVHVGVLGAMMVVLTRRCPLSLPLLRGAELLVFGVTAAFLACVQHIEVLYCALTLGFVPNPTALWYTIILIYAIFIPNHWKRAAVVVGIFALMPVVGLMIDARRHVEVLDFMRQYNQLSAVALAMLLAWGTSVYGAHLINSLRREAYEARQVGQYHLRHLLGAGGMGEVYLAEHQLLKRPCAIKIIRPHQASDPTALARFEREVHAIARLSHWNTVEIFDYGRTEDGTFYYVMEYLPGLNLAELVARHGPLPAERVIYLLRQVCDALSEAHALGLMHRDVKPQNIFAAHRGGYFDVAKLLDFGLAKQILSTPDSLAVTQVGTVTGSPLYMAPEQALGDHEPDARSDIYALGAVAYFLLTGRPPFESENHLRLVLSHARDPVVVPSRLRDDVPADLEQVIMRCLEKRPEDRFQDAASLGRALDACAAAGGWNPQRAAQWWRAHERPLAQTTS